MADAGPDRLRELRLLAGLTLDKLAALLNTKRQTVIRWEKGQNRPSDTFAVELARVFTEQLGYQVAPEEVRPPLPVRPKHEERLQLLEDAVQDVLDELQALRRSVEALQPPQQANGTV